MWRISVWTFVANLQIRYEETDVLLLVYEVFIDFPHFNPAWEQPSYAEYVLRNYYL